MQITGNNRAWLAETGSHMTAHTTIQSPQTGKSVLARKEAVSAGNLDSILRLFRSPKKLAVSWAYCRLQSPRSKIPFPAERFPRANTIWVRFGLDWSLAVGTWSGCGALRDLALPAVYLLFGADVASRRIMREQHLAGDMG